MGTFTKATGKRIECKEVASLNIVMDLFLKVHLKQTFLLTKAMCLEIHKWIKNNILYSRSKEKKLPNKNKEIRRSKVDSLLK
jgi:hypothetical protein